LKSVGEWRGEGKLSDLIEVLPKNRKERLNLERNPSGLRRRFKGGLEKLFL